MGSKSFSKRSRQFSSSSSSISPPIERTPSIPHSDQEFENSPSGNKKSKPIRAFRKSTSVKLDAESRKSASLSFSVSPPIRESPPEKSDFENPNEHDAKNMTFRQRDTERKNLRRSYSNSPPRNNSFRKGCFKEPSNVSRDHKSNRWSREDSRLNVRRGRKDSQVDGYGREEGKRKKFNDHDERIEKDSRSHPNTYRGDLRKRDRNRDGNRNWDRNRDDFGSKDRTDSRSRGRGRDDESDYEDRDHESRRRRRDKGEKARDFGRKKFYTTRKSRNSSESRDRYSDNEDDRSSYKSYKEADKAKLLTYKEFLLMQKDDITPEEAQKLYNQYKNEFQQSSTRIFFERHRDEEWFKEKYNPTSRTKIFTLNLKISEKNSKEFFKELQESTLNKESLIKFVEKHDLNRDKEAFEFIKNIEKDLEIDGETERVKEIESRLYDERHKGGEFSESDSESNLPLPKNKSPEDKNFSADVEKKKDGIFSSNFGKNLSTLGRNIARSTQNRIPKSSINCDENSVFVSTIPLKVTRADLERVFEMIKGFQKMCVSEPIPKYNMNRFAWVTFDSQEHCAEALKLNGHKIKYCDQNPPLYLHILPKKKSSKCVRPAHFYTLLEKRVDFDIKQALKVIERLNERKIFEEKFDEKLLNNFPSKITQLNLLMTYLRHAHWFCYYCGVNYMTEEGLMSRCTKNHPRNAIIKLDREKNFRFSSGKDVEDDFANDYKKWTRDLDDKINDFLDKDTSKNIIGWIDIKEKEFFEKSKEQRLGKPRCKHCKKLFVADDFLKKHVWNRHGGLLRSFLKVEDERDFYKNYENDSNKFVLENVEPIIPGDMTSYGTKNPKSFYRPLGPTKGFTSSIYSNDNGRSNYKKFSGNRGKRSFYIDLDKPPGDGEEDVDYGFASESLPMFHL